MTAVLTGSTQLLSVIVLLLSLGLLANGHWRRHICSAQYASVGAAALLQAVVQSDLELAVACASVAAQGVMLHRSKYGSEPSRTSPVLRLGAGLAVIVLAMITAPSEIVALPLAVVLVGLLAATGKESALHGTLCVLNGGLLMAVLTPDLPMRSVAALALSVVAITAMGGSVPGLRLRG